MKVEIVERTKPIDVFGREGFLEVTGVTRTREMHIDDKPVPKALADIFFLGLDVATEQYKQMLLEAKRQGLLVGTL